MTTSVLRNYIHNHVFISVNGDVYLINLVHLVRVHRGVCVWPVLLYVWKKCKIEIVDTFHVRHQLSSGSKQIGENKQNSFLGLCLRFDTNSNQGFRDKQSRLSQITQHWQCWHICQFYVLIWDKLSVVFGTHQYIRQFLSSKYRMDVI